MKSLIASIAILALVGLVVGVGVQGATEGTVTATVTVQNVSVTVSDGVVAYGTLAVDSSKDTTSTGVDNSQTATNNGNITENLNIRGVNTSDTGGSWTLGATAGDEVYVHEFCNNGNCDSSPTWTALTTSNQTLASSVSASGSQEFDLQITTPTVTADFTSQSPNVTVQASL